MTKILGFSPVPFVLSALATASLISCSPKDERVTSGAGSFNRSGGATAQTDSRFSDRSSEYSRSMLIEVAEAARQAESVIHAVDQREIANAQAIAAEKTEAEAESAQGAGAAAPVVPVAPLRAAACKQTQVRPSPEGTLKFETEFKGCKEQGASFEGTQYGREAGFASVVAGAAGPVVTVIKVEGRGIETILKPTANPKDTLRLKNSRFFEAVLVSEENGRRTYRFTYENYGNYDLDLKSFTDLGAIKSMISGVLVYDVASKTMVEYRSEDDSDRMTLKVDSARQGRNGARIVRQEFFGSGVAAGESRAFALDLATCSLPMGSVKSRFTVRPLVGEKKYTIDSSTVINSFKDHVINTKLTSSKAKTSASLCSPEEQITMTEFYAGLLY